VKREFRLSNRREFFGQAAGALALLNAIAAQRASAAKSVNPFAYDLTSLLKTDPKLVKYEESARWKAPQTDARRIAVGKDDTLYVCAGNYVTALTTSGELKSEIAFTEPPRCVAADEDGTIFIGLRDHVEVFDAKGQRKATWDSAAKKPWLTAIALSESDAFVADSGNRVVLRYDKSGKLVRRIGEKDRERNIPGFVVPSPFLDIEIASDGLLRINNPGRHRVEIYTPDGDLEGSWGIVGMGITGFCGCCNPIALTLLPDGRCITCEKGIPRVKIYSADGQFECVVAGAETFSENARACGPSDCTSGGMDAVADSQGRIYILDFVAGNVRVMQHKT
jgi:hypothetical protein